jgi:tetratricopeptide (TPR) repeat protein
MRPVLTTLIALSGTAASIGCASGALRRQNAAALATADARVLEGCYDCLDEARSVYARLVGAKKNVIPKNVGSMAVRLFETDLLIALRRKEMGLDPHPSLDEARSLAPKMPAALEASRVLTIVDAVLPDSRAMSMKAYDAIARLRKPFVGKVDDELAWLDRSTLTPAVRTYVALALECSYFDRHDGDTTALAKRRAVPVNAPPLVTYRAAHCAANDTLALKRVLLQVPSFVEAAYALGNVVVWFAGETGGDDAQRYYHHAYVRFPRAAGVTFMSAWLNLNIGDCVEAVRLYDTTLEIEPAHERALLQKAMCQSNMRQDSAAISTATRFIALGPSDIAQGYYWRAVSRLRRRELDLARHDADSAKARTARGAGEILTLAGIIEHEQEDFAIAETDLRGARAMPKGSENCNAAFYLGSVLTKREAWPEAAASYDSAMVCYDDQANFIAAKIEQVRRSTKGSPQFRAKRIAALETDLADRRKRNQSSAFNAASMNARLGNYARAEELLAVAALSPDLTDQVAKLREQLAAVKRGQSRFESFQRPFDQENRNHDR